MLTYSEDLATNRKQINSIVCRTQEMQSMTLYYLTFRKALLHKVSCFLSFHPYWFALLNASLYSFCNLIVQFAFLLSSLTVVRGDLAKTTEQCNNSISNEAGLSASFFWIMSRLS